MTGGHIELVIDEVVLRGVPHAHAATVVVALQGELATLAGAAPPFLADGTAATVRSTRPDGPAATPEALGILAAQAVWNAATSTGGR